MTCMAKQLFTLRQAREDDRKYIDAYTQAEGMDFLPSLERVTVAVNAADEPVGFIRIVLDSQGVAHVNPVVVLASWRRHSVGKALVNDAQRTYGEIRLVSRGSSKPFYDALGFECCEWDLIEEGVSEDCAHCDMIDECCPQPMRRLEIPKSTRGDGAQGGGKTFGESSKSARKQRKPRPKKKR